MQFPKPVARALKGLGRRAPKPVKVVSRKVLAPFLKSTVASRALPKHLHVDNGLGVRHEIVGDTYEPESLLPMLALENEALRQHLFSALEAQETIERPQAIGGSPTAPEANNDPLIARANCESYLSAQGQAKGKPRHLVIANNYPRTGSEYANGFVHRRVLHYLDNGAHVDVVVAGYTANQEIFEYEGVRVLEGNGTEIDEILTQQSYTSVSVHFLNEKIWNYLKPHLDSIKLHVFVHGYEVSHWIRRTMNLPNGTSLERAIDRTIRQQHMWRQVIDHSNGPASFIFVSEWLHKAASQDMRVHFPPSRTHIVHNVIDTSLFSYAPKDPGQRFRILWVRSAHNLNYGHDIAIATIRLLAQSPLWKNIDIRIIGDGGYFPEFREALKNYPNVSIEQGFISQSEISRLHKEYGIFLVPSRLDTQGVSRDEAMASGLVVATNSVCAIPEFVSDQEAILSPKDDASDLANGIIQVMKDPILFLQKSQAAALRVRAQSGFEMTVKREMQILGIEPMNSGLEV